MRYRLQEKIPAFDEWENLIECDDLVHLHTLVIKHYQYRTAENHYRILDNESSKYDTIAEFYGRTYL